MDKDPSKSITNDDYDLKYYNSNKQSDFKTKSCAKRFNNPASQTGPKDGSLFE